MTDGIAALREEIAQLRAELAETAAAARKASDYHEICNLQAAYGYYVDKGRWDDAADLFAADGTLELAGRGVYVGRERVRAYLHHLPPMSMAYSIITCNYNQLYTSTARPARPRAAGAAS